MHGAALQFRSPGSCGAAAALHCSRRGRERVRFADRADGAAHPPLPRCGDLARRRAGGLGRGRFARRRLLSADSRPRHPACRQRRRNHGCPALRPRTGVLAGLADLESRRQPPELHFAYTRQSCALDLFALPPTAADSPGCSSSAAPSRTCAMVPTAGSQCWPPPMRSRKSARPRRERRLPAIWMQKRLNSASPCSKAALCTGPPRPICSSMSTTGGRPAKVSWARPRPATAMTIGGPPSSTPFRRSAAARVIYSPASLRQQLAAPKVSRDGRTVAFIAGIMSDFGSTGGDVYTLPAEGGQATNVTPGLKASATALAWGCDGHLQAQLLAADSSQLADLGDGRTPGSVRPAMERCRIPRAARRRRIHGVPVRHHRGGPRVVHRPARDRSRSRRGLAKFDRSQCRHDTGRASAEPLVEKRRVRRAGLAVAAAEHGARKCRW